MCDNKLNNGFEKITSSEDINFQPPSISIGFTGPTDPVNAVLSSKPNLTKAILTNQVSIESKGPICQFSTTIITFPAKIQIGKIKSGPYTDTGGKIDFRDIYFNFIDITFELQVKYEFDPSLVCDETKPQTYNIDNKPFSVDVQTVSFDKSKYFATNGDDDSNLNIFQKDLGDLFSDAKSSFVQFFNALISGLLNQSALGRNLESTLDKIYCSQEKNIVNTYILFEDKIKRIERMGIYFKDKNN